MSKHMKQKTELNTPGGLLMRLKNKILTRMKIDYTRFNLLVERYAIKLNGGRKNSDSQSSRTNMMAAFNGEKLTINRFFNFLMSLELKKVKITITITTKDDEVIEVDETVHFKNDEAVTSEGDENAND